MEQVSSLQEQLVNEIHITQFEVYDDSYYIVYDVLLESKLYAVKTKIDRKKGWFEIVEDNGLKDKLLKMMDTNTQFGDLEAESLINKTTREALKLIKV